MTVIGECDQDGGETKGGSERPVTIVAKKTTEHLLFSKYLQGLLNYGGNNI